jgi:hypothetical protein
MKEHIDQTFDEEVAKLINSAARYVQNAARYRQHLKAL